MTGRPATPRELAVLRHADQRSTWVVVLRATLAEPLTPEVVGERLERVAREQAPVVGSRLAGEAWFDSEPPVVGRLDGDLLGPLTTRFALDAEPPVRVAITADARTIALGAHHSAIDGLGLVALLRALVDAPAAQAARGSRAPRGEAGPAASGRAALRRLLRPADRVAPSVVAGPSDSFAAARVRPPGPARGSFSARVAAACVVAAGARNGAAGEPWRRIGLSIGVGGGGSAGDRIGNDATYSRVDLAAGEDVVGAVDAALRRGGEPSELVRPGRWLRLLAPVASRLSDSLLVSNLGRLDLPGVRAVEFYPVARGRSAVAFGAAAVGDGPAVVTIRARDLDADDAGSMLDDTVAALLRDQ